jgi:hypothetical protein
MSDLQAYLASKYMTGAKAEAILDRAGGVPEGKRRKKRKVESLVGGVASGSGSTSGMVIADDNDESSWKGKGGRGVGEDEEEEGRPGWFHLFNISCIFYGVSRALHCSNMAKLVYSSILIIYLGV